MCQKMANEQTNTQTSQLDEEDLKKLKEAISENNGVVAPCKAEKLMSVGRRRAKLARPVRAI